MSLQLEQSTGLIDEAAALTNTLLEAQLIINKETDRKESELVTELRASGIFGDVPDFSDIPAVDPALVDVNILTKDVAISPRLLNEALPARKGSPQAITTKLGRDAIGDILVGTDNRLIVIAGPCSVHNAEEALAYAENVRQWRDEFGEDLEIIMRVYFEKPRSEDGWKGLIYDPRLDGSHDVNLGLTLSRMTAHRITGMGVPTAMERLNTTTPQFMNGLVAFDTVGARSVEHQPTREYISGTSSIAGFKNMTDGDVGGAISAEVTARKPHTFLGQDESGLLAIVHTKGNTASFIVLRGGKNGPNYEPEYIAAAKEALTIKSRKIGQELPQAILVDTSHGNSNKIAANQHLGIESIAEQVSLGETAIKGVLIESYLRHGKQDLGEGSNLEPEISITDECVSIDETYLFLQKLSDAAKSRRTVLAVN